VRWLDMWPGKARSGRWHWNPWAGGDVQGVSVEAGEPQRPDWRSGDEKEHRKGLHQ
jgi:hypothetical protein